MGSIERRRYQLGATIYALLSLAGCAHVLHGAHDPGVVPPVARCSPDAPPPTHEVLCGDAGGLVYTEFTVREDGSIADIAQGQGDPDPDPKLFAATRDWLSQCKYQPATLAGSPIPVHMSKIFGFYLPYAIDRSGAPPLDWSAEVARTLSPPRFIHCFPNDPIIFDSISDIGLSVVVQRDGRIGDTRAEHLSDDAEPGYKLAALWLRTCQVEPARNGQGDPVAVRVPLTFLFNDGPLIAPPREPLPIADGKSLPIPEPTSNCDLHPWLRAQKGTGSGSSVADETLPPIEVAYTVDTQGNASDVALLTPARREVFHAVRRYVLGCQFLPVHDETGEALRVRVRRAFNLRLGTRKLRPNGPDERVIEGDPP